MDDFLEKFRTAVDPPSRPFFEKMFEIFSIIFFRFELTLSLLQKVSEDSSIF